MGLDILPLMVRLLAVDMDGTLLTSQRVPHPLSAQALLQAQAAGIMVCLASGRAIQTMRPTIQSIGLTGPVVSSNGAYVELADGTPVLDRKLDPQARDTLLAYAEARGMHVNFYLSTEMWFSHDGPEAASYRERTGIVAPVTGYEPMKSAEAVKILFFAEADEIVAAMDDLRPTVAELGITMVTSEPDYVEFLPAGITKGAGLQALAKALSLEAPQVAAIGDWLNDLEMIQWAGVSAAMGNAAEDVKAAAQMVVGTNEDGGVADFVRTLLPSIG